jgi:hypothetical protein
MRKIAVGIHFFFLQIEAVGAIQIALEPVGLAITWKAAGAVVVNRYL